MKLHELKPAEGAVLEKDQVEVLLQVKVKLQDVDKKVKNLVQAVE